jgi:Bacterial transcriptional activator domain
VAFALWPDSTEAQALTNLRHVLHNVRRSFPELDRHVEVTTRTLRWRDDQPYRLDAGTFEDALKRGALADAVGAYAGDLLRGRTDGWVHEERARLRRRRYMEALDRLVAESQERGDLTSAVGYAERLVREEPLREETYLVLMRLHDARGDAAPAALTLTEDGHDGRTYTLTGPEALRYHDLAAQLSHVLGRTVEFVDVPDAAVGAALQAQAPEWLAHGLVEVHRQLKRGIAAQTTDVVRVLLGREPYSFTYPTRATVAIWR